MMNFKLSAYQENILNTVKLTDKNILVDAKAGSGKTSTLILISEAIQKQGNKCLFLAFNKHIVEELKGKMDTTDCAVKTIHSLGYSYLRSFLYRQYGQHYKMDLDENKLREIVKHKFEEDGYQQSVIEHNIDKTGTELKDFVRTLISETCHLINFCRFHMTNYHEQDKVRKLALSCCRTIIEENIGFDNYPTLVESVIDKLKNDFENPEIKDGLPTYKVDFTDMIYFPVYYKMIPPWSIREYLDYVLIDECQDLSELQQEFLKTLGNNSRFNDETFIFKAKIKENCISNTFKKVNYGINEQIYFINNVFLKYIAVHKIDNLNLRACKDARSKTNAFIREQYLDSNLLFKLFGNCCYEVNVFWYDGECDNIFDVAKKIISKLNPETRSDFKKINIIYLAKENKIVCKRYDGALKYYYISVKQFFYYRNCIRLFCRLYNIDIKMFTHLL